MYEYTVHAVCPILYRAVCILYPYFIVEDKIKYKMIMWPLKDYLFGRKTVSLS